MTTDRHTPLGRTDWALWDEAALRGAGFPAERFAEICDEELAAAADLVDDGAPATREQYAKVYAEATERLSATISRTAADPLFRAAVTWQNPKLVRDCLDKAAAGEPRNVRGRNHELTIASYLQRYCLKNETIGFFGPVGWARIGAADTGLTATPGPDLLASRTTYFEGWAIEAVADVIADRPEVWPWLRPRVEPSAKLTGWVVRLPFRRSATLTAPEVRVLRQCEGRRTVRDITGDPPDPATVATLLRLRERGVVRIDLGGALVTYPERELAERIDAIGDPAVRARAREPLDELVAARDAVAAVAGDPDALVTALGDLDATFERITGRAPHRRSGSTYAGRTQVYEDAARGVDAVVGRRIINALAAPLGLVLDSAVWFVNTVGAAYEAHARKIFDKETGSSGNSTMPLLQLLTTLMPELARVAGGGAGSEVVEEVAADFQERWRRVIELPAHARRVHVAAEEIADRAAREFTTGSPQWDSARWYSPDLMIAANDQAALARGDVDIILGELHAATNTLEAQLFAAQHPDTARLRELATASGLDRRIMFIPRLDTPFTTSRMSRADELMLPNYTYISIGAEAIAPPPSATLLSVLDLVVQRSGDELVVRHPTDGVEYPFLEAIGEPLSALTYDRFRPVGGTGHRPRVTVDRLVIGRESWTFDANEPAWAFVKDECKRYEMARRWRSAHGLPERGFVRVAVERKPTAVDFRSLPMVNLLAKSIRRTVEAGGGTVTITEMLPDVDRLWLRDASGARYTAELRIVAVRRR